MKKLWSRRWIGQQPDPPRPLAVKLVNLPIEISVQLS